MMVEALEQHKALWNAPWTSVLLGRRATGKTTWLNHVTGLSEPTGLGGVTQEVSPHHADGRIWVDTPGFDDPGAALLALHDVVGTADAIVFFVDALQPLTQQERTLLTHLHTQQDLHVVVGKADLLDHDDGSVVQRVSHLLAEHNPRSVTLCNIRKQPAPPHPARLPGPRTAALVSSSQALLEQLPPAPPDLDQAKGIWRTAVQQLTEELSRENATHKRVALQALAERSEELVVRVTNHIGWSLRLPRPTAPGTDPWGHLMAGMSGEEGARRALRAASARWLAEGELALTDHWLDDEAPAQRVREHEALLATLEPWLLTES